MACTAEGRSAKGRSCRHTPAANLPVRLPSGAGRAHHEPPARSLPRGPTPGADGSRARRVRVRAPARGPIPGSACQSGRCGRLVASRSRPAGRPGTEADEERVRGGGGGRGGGAGSSLGSVRQPVSQVRCQRRERGSEGPLSGRGGGGTGCPPVERRLLRRLRRKIGKLRMLIPSGKNHLFPLTKNCIKKEREALLLEEFLWRVKTLITAQQ
ncbi:laforin [Physeter macrocephalus]|uniref:Laforin n=1 Tax=Physeter macrocephalus TaxID=9755 RepID=A0A455AQ34_PHYMC|nr:laforin [Physeter catodon]|eukprot:XP_028338687.1 laforin-like [Physeter catodon]